VCGKPAGHRPPHQAEQRHGGAYPRADVWEWSPEWRPVPVGRVRVGSSALRVLLAVQRLEYPTVRGVAASSGLSLAVTHRHLLTLRREGLVSWEPRKAGTLRAVVREVPFG
jgi:hypothetical protein